MDIEKFSKEIKKRIEAILVKHFDFAPPEVFDVDKRLKPTLVLQGTIEGLAEDIMKELLTPVIVESFINKSYFELCKERNDLTKLYKENLIEALPRRLWDEGVIGLKEKYNIFHNNVIIFGYMCCVKGLRK